MLHLPQSPPPQVTFAALSLSLSLFLLVGFISYEIVWPLLWCHTLVLHDTSASVSHRHGVQHSSYLHSGSNTKQVTANFGPLAVSALSPLYTLCFVK